MATPAAEKEAEALAAAATKRATATVEAAEKLAAMARQEAVGGCKEMIQHIRQIDTTAAVTGKVATTETAAEETAAEWAPMWGW